MSAVLEKQERQTMKITKVKEHIGAIVTGIDLAAPIDAATKKALYDAAVDNVVLVIRGQAHLTPAQVQAAGELFGELMEDQNRRYLVDGFPLISVLDNFHLDSTGKPAKVGANSTWHTDHTNQELPPKFTMLYAVAVPDKGGATGVCNSRAAYEALPEDLRQKNHRHENRKHVDQQRAFQDRQPGYSESATGIEKAADDTTAGAHPPRNRHQGRVVPQKQDRKNHRHDARRDAGFPAGHH